MSPKPNFNFFLIIWQSQSIMYTRVLCEHCYSTLFTFHSTRLTVLTLMALTRDTHDELRQELGVWFGV